MNNLSKELIELSQVVEKHNNIITSALIIPDIELSNELTLPLRFKARVFAPGKFMGYTFKKNDIVRNMNTIFKVNKNVANNELNLDHKNNRKEDSDMKSLIGRVVGVEYNNSEDTLWMDCEVFDEDTASKIKNKLYKYVSLRINPYNYYEENFEKIVDEFDFEELSIVRNPGYDNARIEAVY